MHTITAKIPIFITFRGNTEENFLQSKTLLKFAYIFIEEQNLFSQTFVISDNQELLDYAKELGFLKFIYYPCKNDYDITYLEYLATFKFGNDNNYWPDWIIILNATQLFRSSNIIRDCIRNIDDKYDVIASYTEISDRQHFFIDESRNSTNNHTPYRLITSERHRVKMIDAAIYAIKTTFARSCMDVEDPSQKFWNGNFKFFKNNSLYSDIYTSDDIQKYHRVNDILNRVSKL